MKSAKKKKKSIFLRIALLAFSVYVVVTLVKLQLEIRDRREAVSYTHLDVYKRQDLSRAYTPRLQQLAAETAEKLGISLRRGVYFYMAGPQFETPAEIRAIRLLGGDAVGMSTVPEVLAAAQCLSLIHI